MPADSALEAGRSGVVARCGAGFRPWPSLLAVLLWAAVSLAHGQSNYPRSDEDSRRTDEPRLQRPQPEGADQIKNSTTPPLPDDRQQQDGRPDRRQVRDERIEERPEPPSEFQTFIFNATGYRLENYGSSLFHRVPSTFAPVDRVPVTADYEIGPGDELLLRGWGQVDIDYKAVVDRSGNIFIPKVGNIAVSGLKFRELQPYLKSTIGRVFHDFDLNVTMGQLRSIQVFVVGQARRPGAYTVSSLSTLVNALFASGGPSSKGSMRHIQLKRGDRVMREFDLYDLLLNGDKSKDATLLPGDVIYVPPIGPQVAIVGSVNVPAIYELKATSTLKDAVGYAGGFVPTAVTESVVLERISEHAVRTVQQVRLDGEGLTTPLKDGDLITVRALSPRFDNAITLRGNVAVPGRFPWRAGLRIRDLIPNQESLLTREYWHMQGELGRFLPAAPMPPERKESEDEEQKPQDPRVTDAERMQAAADRPRRDSSRAARMRVNEAQPEDEELSGELKLANDVDRMAPGINWDYAVVQRLDRQKLVTNLIPFNLGLAIQDAASKENLALEPGDVITIFSQVDIKGPLQRRPKYVRLEGEFPAAGVYEVQPGETLSQLVTRLGGLTTDAYLFGSEFTRRSTRQAQQKRLDQFVSQLERDVERISSSRSQNVLNPEEAAGLAQKVESQRRLVSKLREMKATGRIVLGIGPTQTSVDALPHLVLEDGDRFFVPYRPAMVNVVGAVYNENSFLHQPSKGPSQYLRQAGGPTREADASRTFVIRADGSIVGRRRAAGWFAGGFDDTRIMPGDTIVVPERLDATGWLKGLKDWSQVLGQFALGAAAIRTLTRN